MMSVFLLSEILSHRHRCKLRASVWVCVSVCVCVYMNWELGGCYGREWHRWHRAPAVPRASDRHVAHSQPHTTYAKGGRRERERLNREGGMSNTNNIPLPLLALPAALLHCLFSFCATSLFTSHL